MLNGYILSQHWKSLQNRNLCCIDRDYVVVKYFGLFVRNIDIYSEK